jgi:hypothetical protein
LCSVRRIFIGVVATYLLVSLTLGGTRSARPIFYALTLGCVAWFWFRRKHAALPQTNVIRVFEVVAFNIALTLFLGELSLRAFAAYSGQSLVVSDSLDAYRLTPGKDYGRGLHGNSLGFPGADFREQKRPGVFRIVAFGDSFAVGPSVPFDENYLTLLERMLLSTEVYNFGVSGTGPREYSLLLNRYARTYQPDFVLVSIFVGNDITEMMATPREMDPRQSSLYLLLTRGAKLVREKFRQSDSGMETEAWRMENDSAGAGLSPQTFRETEARRLAVCLKSPPAALEKKWLKAEAYLGRIIAECQKHGVPVGFVLIPDEFQVNAAVLEDALQDSHIDRQSIDIEAPQRRLVRFFEERGVPCLDLEPAFSGIADAYASRDTHWNVRGNRLAAKCIRNWLESLPYDRARRGP